MVSSVSLGCYLNFRFGATCNGFVVNGSNSERTMVMFVVAPVWPYQPFYRIIINCVIYRERNRFFFRAT